MREIEVLAPAGSFDTMKAAYKAGADAVYMGGPMFGARAYADNADAGQMLSAIDYAHLHGRKLYMTVNTLLKDRELNELYAYLLPYYKAGLDGVIVQDIGAVKFIGEYFPEMPVHASTQMTITNTLGADFLKRYGITRVVPARELSLKEIRDMKKQTGLEMECFVHGALCYCYSGQCLLSSMIGGRSGNRGQCAQPCRLPYQTEGKKPADLMSLKDLCTIDILPELIDAGIDSFKIEGRMKQPEYVYTVVKMYRKYADQYLKLQKEGKGKSSYHVSEADKRELLATYQRRGYCEGYYYQHNGKDMVSLKRPKNGRDGSAEEKPWQDIKVQEKINGILTLSVGNRAKLTVSCGDVTVECIGQEVQAAQKQPLDSARIEKQMRKTGNTEFTFDNLEILIEGNVFLPMQALNELRREGIEELTEQIQMQYRREDAGCGMKKATAGFDSDADGVTETAGKKECCISASVQNKAQLDTAVNSKIRYIYLEEDVEFEREDGVQYFLAMPYIFRENTIKRYEKMYTEIEKKYDGILIRNWESYAWLKQHEYQKEIRSDYNLYIFNRKTKEELRRLGIARGTASVELNDRELARIGIEEQVFIAYGYQPVMISAGCIQKTSASCDGKGGVLSISDRYQKKFAVRRYCRDCYNVMYNSAPLFLADKAEEVHALAPAELRLDFTTESSGQVKEICHAYTLAFEKGCKTEPPMQDYTRGHFKRGVK